jgi:hypothetical protein
MGLQNTQTHQQLGSPGFPQGFPAEFGASPMQDAKINHTTTVQPSSIRFLLLAIILIGILGIGLYVNNIFKAFKPAAYSEGATVITQSMLEEKYGLHVNLIAVTAAGGMVDLRLKITDGEKAKLLLQDNKNFPVISPNVGNFQLNASEETKSQKIKFENNGDLFILFPNAGNAVKPGSTVALVFGDIVVEQVDVR